MGCTQPTGPKGWRSHRPLTNTRSSPGRECKENALTKACLYTPVPEVAPQPAFVRGRPRSEGTSRPSEKGPAKRLTHFSDGLLVLDAPD